MRSADALRAARDGVQRPRDCSGNAEDVNATAGVPIGTAPSSAMARTGVDDGLLAEPVEQMERMEPVEAV